MYVCVCMYNTTYMVTDLRVRRYVAIIDAVNGAGSVLFLSLQTLDCAIENKFALANQYCQSSIAYEMQYIHLATLWLLLTSFTWLDD